MSRSRRTRVVATALWWLSILVLLPAGRPIVDALRGAGLLAVAVSLGFAAVALVVAAGGFSAYRRGELSVRQLGLAVAGAALVVLAAQGLPRFEERWHCVQYTILGGLLWAVFAGRSKGLLWAAALAALLGWLDEGVQFVLPDRVYDWWDVALNALSGVAGATLMEITVRAGGGPRKAQA